jgi:hypothetical protein
VGHAHRYSATHVTLYGRSHQCVHVGHAHRYSAATVQAQGSHPGGSAGPGKDYMIIAQLEENERLRYLAKMIRKQENKATNFLVLAKILAIQYSLLSILLVTKYLRCFSKYLN